METPVEIHQQFFPRRVGAGRSARGQEPHGHQRNEENRAYHNRVFYLSPICYGPGKQNRRFISLLFFPVATGRRANHRRCVPGLPARVPVSAREWLCWFRDRWMRSSSAETFLSVSAGQSVREKIPPSSRW